MKYPILLLFLISACQSKKGEPKSSITGKWEYETIEFYNGDKFDLQDSLDNILHIQHVGLTLSFTGKETTMAQKRPGKPEEFIGKQNYKVEGDTLLRLINRGRPDDTFPIEGLSDSVLKLNLFNSPMGYIVFRRKE